MNYFVLDSDDNSNYPPLNKFDHETTMATHMDELIPDGFTCIFEVDLDYSDAPKVPQMVDYHTAPKPVVSKKIKDVLEPLNLKGVQLVPAEIRWKDKVYKDYFYMHVIVYHQCADKENSDILFSKIDGRIRRIKKFVLNPKLTDIPLEDRLLFRCQEHSSYYFIEESLKNKIMAADPKGIVFIPAEEWTK